MHLVLIFGQLILDAVQSYPSFRNNIPNGEIVPSPCFPNHIWQGVGHWAKGGGGTRNPFGEDFKNNKFTWTKALCTKDSDGDGKTNGQELGDPDCTWTKGSTPKTSLGLTHPGICDPIDATICTKANRFLDCSKTEFVCDALSEPDVMNYTVHLSKTAVPAKETTYMCQTTDIPTDKDYHLVAATPFIDNIHVVHHVVVYGCTSAATITEEMKRPTECFMNKVEHCAEIIAAWGVGNPGLCYHKNAGFRIGKTGYTRILLQLHWTNPMHVNSYKDGSGMTFHLTPNLRKYDAAVMPIGQQLIIIPPGKENHIVTSTCSSECSRQGLTDSIHIFGALNHMHLLGFSAVSQMVLPDGSSKNLSYEENFSYDTPILRFHDDPIEMKPGNSLSLTCHFRSTSRSKTTFYGYGSFDEMCFTIIFYYPKQNSRLHHCASFGSVDACGLENPVIHGCELDSVRNMSHPVAVERYKALQENCRVGMCLEECKEVVRKIMREPCFKWPMIYFNKAILNDPSANMTTKMYAMDFWYRIDSCAVEVEKEDIDKTQRNNGYRGVLEGSFYIIILTVGVSLLLTIF